MRSRVRHAQARTTYETGTTIEWPEEIGGRDDIALCLSQTWNPDPEVRKQAVRTLCPCHLKANHEQVWDRLIAMVADEDPKVRSHILHVLADGSPRSREQEIVQALETMQRDPDVKLRRRVRKLLAQYRRTGKINVL